MKCVRLPAKIFCIISLHLKYSIYNNLNKELHAAVYIYLSMVQKERALLAASNVLLWQA